MHDSTRPRDTVHRVPETAKTSGSAATSSGSATRKIRFEGISGLRVVAAMLVFISHASTLLEEYGYVEDFFTSRGAWMFFVLGGFLFVASAPDHASGVVPYIKKRAVRIYPMYLLVFAAMLAPNLLGLFGTHFDVNPFSILSNATLTQEWLTVDTWRQSLNPPTWSLSVEVFSWFALPYLFFAHRKALPDPSLRTAAWCFAGALVAVMLAGPLPIPRAMREIPFFLVGIELRLMMDRGFTLARKPLWSLLAFVMILSGGGALSAFEGNHLMFMWARFASALGFALIIICLADGRNSRILRSTTMQRVGSWSYAFFLLQTAVLGIVGRIVLESQPSLTIAIGAVAAAALITWASAAVLYRCVDLPLARRIGGGGR